MRRKIHPIADLELYASGHRLTIFLKKRKQNNSLLTQGEDELCGRACGDLVGYINSQLEIDTKHNIGFINCQDYKNVLQRKCKTPQPKYILQPKLNTETRSPL